MAKKRDGSDRFDPTAHRESKLAWVRRVVRDARTCATYYGMEQAELEALGRYLATGEGKP